MAKDRIKQDRFNAVVLQFFFRYKKKGKFFDIALKEAKRHDEYLRESNCDQTS
jgi:hypothetical protein